MTTRSGSRSRTQAIFSRAEELFPGGVNSPVRAFKSVGGQPLVVNCAAGSRIWDADGNEYVDYLGSWGPMILGHAHPAVISAIQEEAARGTSYGVTCEAEVELGERIQKALPSIERLRFVSSGTEATMSAARLARAFTRRNFILKFEGCYHGHGDSFLSEAGSGLATLGIAASPGVPQSLAELTLNAPFNDLAAVEKILARFPNQIAAVFVEPVAANMGVVPPAKGFLSGLGELTRRAGALLVFDEVITGFRVAFGGAQNLFGIAPDLTILGKIIGGGLPVAAYGGRRDVMSLVAPAGPVYQAGTLSGNPLAMRAGIATLEQLSVGGFYDELDRKARLLADGLRAAIAESGFPATVNAFGSLLTLFFTERPVRDYAGARKSDLGCFSSFFAQMRDRGILLPPSQFEAWFVSSAHSEQDLQASVAACRESLKGILHTPSIR